MVIHVFAKQVPSFDTRITRFKATNSRFAVLPMLVTLASMASLTIFALVDAQHSLAPSGKFSFHYLLSTKLYLIESSMCGCCRCDPSLARMPLIVPLSSKTRTRTFLFEPRRPRGRPQKCRRALSSSSSSPPPPPPPTRNAHARTNFRTDIEAHIGSHAQTHSCAHNRTKS